jgi:small conductance mechanosensitive channel
MTLYLQSLYQEALGSTIDFLPKFMSGIFVFLFFVLIYIIAGAVFNRLMATNDSGKRNVMSFLKSFTRVTIALFGLITILGTWGINITAMVAGLGLVGFAAGFALKDMLSNTLAGILILIYKPFNVNDKINACDAEGKIISIDMRYTTLESNGIKHLIPNSKLLSEKVTVLV